MVFSRLAFANNFDHQHQVFSKILNKSLKKNLVDYSFLKGNSQELKTYLDSLASVNKDTFKQWRKKQQLAFLINLYNASTLQLVIQHHPIKSIKNIKKSFKGPWDIKFIPLFGEVISLNHLEHEIIRKKYLEPRIHFALVCAARGCPPLRNSAYTAEKLDQQLNEQTQAFLVNKKRNYIDTTTKTLYLSPIFKWYKEDFPRSVQDFVAGYIRETENMSDYKIQYTDYDWSLWTSPDKVDT